MKIAVNVNGNTLQIVKIYLLFHFKVSSIAGNGSVLNPSINGEYKCVASNIAGQLTFSKQITTNWVDIFIHNKLGKLVVLGIGVAVIVSVFLLMGVIYFYKRQKVLKLDYQLVSHVKNSIRST